MKRLLLIILISFLLLTLGLVHRGSIVSVKASPDLYQGDLVLNGNNVTTIEDMRFDINGSIIVKENATLILKNAYLNFTQSRDFQYNITFQEPSNGNPRLQADNATLNSAYRFSVYFYGNSSGTFHNVSSWFDTGGLFFMNLYGSSVISILDSKVREIIAEDNSTVGVSSSTMNDLMALSYANVNFSSSNSTNLECFEFSTFDVSESVINYLRINSASVNCSISGLKPDFFSFWNYSEVCSVVVAPGGYAPAITLYNSQIGNWWLNFQGSSNATISDSTVNTVETYSSSVAWLVNSTYGQTARYHQSKIYVSWYLNAHVIDSIGQNVSSATVNVLYPNATVAGSKSTDPNGWAEFALIGKMMNATAEYPVGNYTVVATYGNYSSGGTVNMTGNKAITLTLEGFVIPEFPSFLILPLFMAATLLAVAVHKRRRHSF